MGCFPVSREVTKLDGNVKQLTSDGATLCAVHLSILDDKPSGPLALLASKDMQEPHCLYRVDCQDK